MPTNYNRDTGCCEVCGDRYEVHDDDACYCDICDYHADAHDDDACVAIVKEEESKPEPCRWCHERCDRCLHNYDGFSEDFLAEYGPTGAGFGGFGREGG
jgi:hypothetical protein